MNIFGHTYDLHNFWNVVLFIFVVLFIAWILSRIIRYFLVAFIKRKNTNHQLSITRLKFIKNSVKFFIGIFAIVYIVYMVPSLNKRAEFIFGGAGILAAIFGFAAQAAFSNLIAGAFIVIFRPFRVGDYIKIDDQRLGIVEDITLRHTVINTFENKRLIIPNSIISSESILNNNIEEDRVLSFNNFLIGLTADVDKAIAIVREESLKSPYTLDNRTPEDILNNVDQVPIRIVDIGEAGILIRSYIWVSGPFEEFKAKSDLKHAVHKRFLNEGIDLPIPLRKVINS